MPKIDTRPPELLTINEVAPILRVTRSTAYRLVKSGAIPAHRIGGSIRINRAELDDLLRHPAEGNGRAA